MELIEASCRPWSISLFFGVDLKLLALVFIALLTQSSAGSDDGSVFRIAAANTLFYCQKCFLAIG